MTTPRSPRGIKQKGNDGEALVAAAYRGDGFVWLDGRATESGADGYVLWPDGRLYCVAEVKFRGSEPYDLKPKDKRGMDRRRARCEALGWRYILHYIRDADPTKAVLYRVGKLQASALRKGLSLPLYQEGFLPLGASKYGVHREVNGLPSQSVAESGAVEWATGKPLGRKPSEAPGSTPGPTAPPAEPCPTHLDGLHRGWPCACEFQEMAP